MEADKIRLQINTSKTTRDRAKAVAYSRGLDLNEFVLQALAKEGDKELTASIKKDLAERTSPGRPKNK